MTESAGTAAVDRGTRPAVEPDVELVRALPKVELHLHLEGTFSAERIAVLAARAGEALPRPLDELFRFEALSDFLEFLDWTCGLVRTRELAEQVAHDLAAQAAAVGTRYAEVILNPTHWSSWDLAELVEAVTVGFERARADGHAECHLVLSILRTQSATEALELVEWMGRTRPRRVVGLSVDGDESRTGPTAERFAPAYRRAAELGYGLTAHAGESSGPQGVQDAVELLGVSRVDHGVRAIEDEQVLELLRTRDITLNVCLSSNLVLMYDDERDHPLPALDAAGVKVTVNTDDPAYMDTDLLQEYLRCARLVGWDLQGLAAASRRAVDAAFCSEATAAELRSQIAEFMDRAG